MSKTKSPVVLLVEDDPGDRELTKRTLRRHGPEVQLHMVKDGEEALDYLQNNGPFGDPKTAPKPDLVLLDLNLPKLSGHKVLERIRSCDPLRHIPVVVLTTSRHERDIAELYDLGCNAYICKPVDLGQFAEIVRNTGVYWFNLVSLPSKVLGSKFSSEQ